MESPLAQFEVKKLIALQFGGVDVSFTNSALYVLLAGIACIVVLRRGMRHPTLVPSRFQTAVEFFYEFIQNLLKENAGHGSQVYFPFVFSLFLIILFGNLIGMIPGAFTFTGQIVLTFTLAVLVFLVVTIVGLVTHGWRFLKMFMPEGAPGFLAPILVPVEMLSYFSRPVSLCIRLFANMMAGHTMLKVFAIFTAMLGVWGIFSTLLLNAVLIGFEFLVAFLQAYVFTVLTCLYLHDALHSH